MGGGKAGMQNTEKIQEKENFSAAFYMVNLDIFLQSKIFSQRESSELC